MSVKPVLRVRKSGALLVAAMIAFVGTVPVAGARWALAPLLLIPLLVGYWAWRVGTDVFPDRLRVRALLGATDIGWERIVALSPDRRRRVSAQLENGNAIRLTGVTTANLPSVLAAAGQQIDRDATDQ